TVSPGRTRPRRRRRRRRAEAEGGGGGYDQGGPRVRGEPDRPAGGRSDGRAAPWRGRSAGYGEGSVPADRYGPLAEGAVHSLRTVSGAVIRRSRGSVEAMTARAAASPPATLT